MILRKEGSDKYKFIQLGAQKWKELTYCYLHIIKRSVKDSDMTHVGKEEFVIVKYDKNKKNLIDQIKA